MQSCFKILVVFYIVSSCVFTAAGDDLIAHWSFESSSGNIFKDQTGNGFNIISSTPLSTSNGKSGNAIELADTQFKAVVENSAEPFYLQTFTVEAWIQLYGEPAQMGRYASQFKILDYSAIEPDVRNGFSLSIFEGGKPGVSIGTSTWIDCISPNPLSQNTWYHITGTYDGSELRLYVNGVLVAVTTIANKILPVNANAVLGCQIQTDSIARCHFYGKIDELKLFDYALDSVAVMENYQSLAPAQNSLIAYWSFDSLSTETIFDVTKNGFNASYTKLNVTNGVLGKALDCSTSDFDVTVNNSLSNFQLSNFTIESWIYSYVDLVNPGSFDNDKCIFNYQQLGPENSGNSGGYGVSVTRDGKFCGGVAIPGGWLIIESDEILKSRTWYHTVFTYDGSFLKIFLNGTMVKKTEFSGAYLPSDVPAKIGLIYKHTTEAKDEGRLACRFEGKIDELKLYNYALDPSVIKATYNELNPDQQRKLIAHWSFDSLTNSTVKDISGNGYDAICKGIKLNDAGVSGKALDCNSTTHNVTVSNSVGEFELKNFTIEGWIYSYENLVNPGAFENYRVIFEYVRCIRGSNNGGYGLKISDYGKLVLTIANPEQSPVWINVISDETLQPNKWYHVASTYDGLYIKLFINGKLVKKMAYSAGYLPSDIQAQIGSEHLLTSTTTDTVYQRFQGKIDELKLYNYALDSIDIEATYNNLKPAEPPKPFFEINLGMKNTYAQAGDTVVMPVFLSNFENFEINSCNLSLHFDSDKIKLLEVSRDSGIIRDWPLFEFFTPESGTLNVGMAGTTMSLGYGEGEIFRCLFLVNQNARQGDEFEINFTDLLIDEHDSIVATAKPGRIIISSKPTLYGDVTGNGQVNVFDAQKVLSYVVGAIQLPDSSCPNFTTVIADVSGNGNVTSYDAALIVQHSIGLLPDFPVTRKALAKRQVSTNEITALLSLERVHSNGNGLIFRLIGKNLNGFIAGEFSILCEAENNDLNGASLTTHVRGATISSRFDPESKILKIALTSKDDINTNDPVTLVEFTLPPTSKLTFKSALLNEGKVKSLIGDPNVETLHPVRNIMNNSFVSCSNNSLFINNVSSKSTSIKIWSLDGKVVRKLNIVGSSFQKIQIQLPAKGLYLYQLKDGKSVISGRIILQ